MFALYSVDIDLLITNCDWWWCLVVTWDSIRSLLNLNKSQQISRESFQSLILWAFLCRAMAVSSEMKVVFAAKCILLDWNAAAALQNDNLMGCFLSQKKYLYIFCLMSYILHFLCLRPVFNSRSILSFDILLLDMIHGHYRPTPRYMIQYPPLRHITDGYTAYQAEDLMDTCPEYHHGMARLYCVWVG